MTGDQNRGDQNRREQKPSGEGLRLEALTVAFGGHVAVDAVTLDAPLGRITGLIGPNGAGKTTVFNACSGLLSPASGRVHLFGRDATGDPPSARARAGLGRTFQRVEGCNNMTVRENVALGAEARAAGRSAWHQVFPSRATRGSVAAETDAALARCGLEPLAGRLVATLSTGQRRLLELARATACRSRFVLLDEPSSGLDEEETKVFGRIVVDWVADTGVGVLLVEHDMALVMEICTRLHVLEFGRLVFSGPPAEAQASPVVRAAYLGDDVDVGVGAR
jgi:ABC-type branched-subunit amino acid transport system ATPase component